MLKSLRFEYTQRHVQLIICIGTCGIIYLASKSISLAAHWVIFCLVIGMFYAMLQRHLSKMSAQNPYKTGVSILRYSLPILALLAFSYALPQFGFWLLLLQGLGFIILGSLIVSIQAHRAHYSGRR